MKDRLKRILGASMIAGMFRADAELPLPPQMPASSEVKNNDYGQVDNPTRRPSLLETYNRSPLAASDSQSENPSDEDFSRVAEEVISRFPDSKDVATVGFDYLQSGDTYYARLGNEIVFSKMVDKNKKPYIIERVISVREEEDGSLSVRSGASIDDLGQNSYVELNLSKDDDLGEMLERVIAFEKEYDRTVRAELDREAVPGGLQRKADRLKALLAFCDRIVDGQPYIPLTPEKRKVIEDSITLYEQVAQ